MVVYSIVSIVLLQNPPREVDENTMRLIDNTGTDTNIDGVSETLLQTTTEFYFQSHPNSNSSSVIPKE